MTVNDILALKERLGINGILPSTNKELSIIVQQIREHGEFKALNNKWYKYKKHDDGCGIYQTDVPKAVTKKLKEIAEEYTITPKFKPKMIKDRYEFDTWDLIDDDIWGE